MPMLPSYISVYISRKFWVVGISPLLPVFSPRLAIPRFSARRWSAKDCVFTPETSVSTLTLEDPRSFDIQATVITRCMHYSSTRKLQVVIQNAGLPLSNVVNCSKIAAKVVERRLLIGFN